MILPSIKAQMLDLLDKRGAKYPAEHNVGHLYAAGADQAEFYKTSAIRPIR